MFPPCARRARKRYVRSNASTERCFASRNGRLVSKGSGAPLDPAGRRVELCRDRFELSGHPRELLRRRLGRSDRAELLPNRRLRCRPLQHQPGGRPSLFLILRLETVPRLPSRRGGSGACAPRLHTRADDGGGGAGGRGQVRPRGPPARSPACLGTEGAPSSDRGRGGGVRPARRLANNHALGQPDAKALES